MIMKIYVSSFNLNLILIKRVMAHYLQCMKVELRFCKRVANYTKDNSEGKDKGHPRTGHESPERE